MSACISTRRKSRFGRDRNFSAIESRAGKLRQAGLGRGETIVRDGRVLRNCASAAKRILGAGGPASTCDVPNAPRRRSAKSPTALRLVPSGSPVKIIAPLSLVRLGCFRRRDAAEECSRAASASLSSNSQPCSVFQHATRCNNLTVRSRFTPFGHRRSSAGIHARSEAIRGKAAMPWQVRRRCCSKGAFGAGRKPLAICRQPAGQFEFNAPDD